MRHLFLAVLLGLSGSLGHAQQQVQDPFQAPSEDAVQQPEPPQAPAEEDVYLEPAPDSSQEQDLIEPEVARDTVPEQTAEAASAAEPAAAGRWQADIDAALAISAGSSNSQSFHLNADAVYQEQEDKLTLSAQFLQTSATTVVNGVSVSTLTDMQWRVSGRYDGSLSERHFGFVGLELSRDEVRRLKLRTVLSTGLGRHLVKSDAHQWDVFGGVSARSDRYDEMGLLVNDSWQTTWFAYETLFGEESRHELGGSARFQQRWVVYPSLGTDHGLRASFDAGFQFDLNKSMSLSVKLQSRYDSLAQAPATKFDMLTLTGLNMKFRQ